MIRVLIKKLLIIIIMISTFFIIGCAREKVINEEKNSPTISQKKIQTTIPEVKTTSSMSKETTKISVIEEIKSTSTLKETTITSVIEEKKTISISEGKSVVSIPNTKTPTLNNHPRVLVTSKDIEELRQKVISEELSDSWNKLKNESLLYLNSNNIKEIRKSIEANAFIYLIYNDKEKGQLAIDLVKKIIYDDSITIEANNKYYKSLSAGRFILGTAIVYDWCYDLLSNEDKVLFINWIKDLASMLECGYPPNIDRYITGHISENMIIKDLLSAAIAIYDEDSEIYDYIFKSIMQEFIPTRKYMYNSNMHYQGNSYGITRYEPEIYSTWILDKIGYKTAYGIEQSQIPYYWLYTRRPDGQLMRDGDDYFARSWYKTGQYWTTPAYSMLLTYGYFKDPYLKYEYEKEKEAIIYENYDQKIEPLFDIIFSDINVKAKPIGELPLTKYFGSPQGVMIARTGWDDGLNSSNVVAMMKIGEYTFNNHSHLDAGQFQLYYKGALAIDSGIYDSYGSFHDHNYYKRTIAHNSILVYDPNEDFMAYGTSVANDGGQQWPNNKSEPTDIEELLNMDYKQGEVLSISFGPDKNMPEYSYLKGTLNDAYSNKIDIFNRSFVFLNLNDRNFPAALITFDRVVSSNPEYKKTWLLHSIQEPEIVGNSAIIKRTTDGYNGQLILKTLLPQNENAMLTKIGGKNKEFYILDKNYGQNRENITNATEGGAWRIELSPKKPRAEDLFFNIMYVTDADIKGTPNTVKVESNNMVGAIVKDKIVLFSKNSQLINKKINFNIVSNYDLVSCIITDLKAGNWRIISNNKVINDKIYVEEKENVLYFVCGSGEVTLERIQN